MDKLSSLLKAKLRAKMAETGISANALEREAGLRRSAVQNILHGRSKKPSVEILHAITKVLGCSVDELLGRTDSSRQYSENMVNFTLKTQVFEFDLYAKAVRLASQIFKHKEIKLNELQALNYINEIYQYSLNAKSNNIDKHFAEWLADKLLTEK